VVKDLEIGQPNTPKSVQKLQMALHAKAKAEAGTGYRFYALYDKISREDILAHAYAQCRSNKGAPGVDGQDFADVEAYGVGRWLGELALALQEETLPTGPHQKSVHSEIQRQTQAVRYLDVDFIMHLVQLGFRDGEAMWGELATNPAVYDLSRR
jgi:hypothetical protein